MKPFKIFSVIIVFIITGLFLPIYYRISSVKTTAPDISPNTKLINKLLEDLSLDFDENISKTKVNIPEDEEIISGFKKAHSYSFTASEAQDEKLIGEILSKGYTGLALEEQVKLALSQLNSDSRIEIAEVVYFIPPQVKEKYFSEAVIEAGFYFNYQEYDRQGNPVFPSLNSSWGVTATFKMEKNNGLWLISSESWDKEYWD